MLSEEMNIEVYLSENGQKPDRKFHRRLRNELKIGEYTIYYRFLPPSNKLSILLFIIIFMGIYFLILFLIIRHILKPIRQLKKAFVHIAEGNLDKRVEKTSRDEFGELVVHFNAMASELQRMLKNRDQMITDVSHELRSPLARAKVSLAMIEDTEQSRNIRSDLDEMEQLTARLLDLYRMNEKVFKLKMAKSNLNIILEQVLGSISREELITYSPPP